MDRNNAIEVRHMSKQFKIENDRALTLKDRIIFWNRNQVEFHHVLKDINLDIKKGETVALIGTNGSGKSTLLKLMTKIIYPNEGTIETNGKLTSLLELGAGFHPDFTGRENIYFNASIFGLTRQDIDQRIAEIIAFSELEEFIDRPIRTYSSGMYMRLAFSVAINVDADILLIDEILAVGDQHFQDKCYAKLRELRDAGKTIVIVTHSLSVVKELCHRAIWIYKGEFKLDGEPAYVIDEYLKQIQRDHKDKMVKAIERGETKKQGALFIDYPRDLSKMYRHDGQIRCEGWQIANVDDASLVLYFDGQRIESNILRKNRKDVYEVYFEQFVGFLDEETIGWETSFPIENVELGMHTFKAVCEQADGTILTEKEIKLEIVE